MKKPEAPEPPSLQNSEPHLLQPIRVHVIAPELFAWGMARLIETASPSLALEGVSHDFNAGSQTLEQTDPDVLVVQVADLEVTSFVLDIHSKSRAKILAVSCSEDDHLQDAVVLAGARGWVRANDSPNTLLRAIEKVHLGEVWLDRGATGRIFVAMARQQSSIAANPEHEKIARLTKRERQTVAVLAQDSSANGKRLAERLHISENTFRNHLTSVYSKLDLRNRVELYVFAQRNRRHLID